MKKKSSHHSVIGKKNWKNIETLYSILVVIYYGKDNWNIKTTFGEMTNGYEELPKGIKKYVLNYKYLLYYISRYTDEEIKGEA